MDYNPAIDELNRKRFESLQQKQQIAEKRFTDTKQRCVELFEKNSEICRKKLDDYYIEHGKLPLLSDVLEISACKTEIPDVIRYKSNDFDRFTTEMQLKYGSGIKLFTDEKCETDSWTCERNCFQQWYMGVVPLYLRK